MSPEMNERLQCNINTKGEPFMSWNNRLPAPVVDDGITCRMLEKGLLTAYGIESQAVESGPASIQLISSGATFHFFVIDMHLSGMSGLETTRQLRAMGVRSRIIGISILSTEKERRVFLEAGGDHYMEKRMHPEKVYSNPA